MIFSARTRKVTTCLTNALFQESDSSGYIHLWANVQSGLRAWTSYIADSIKLMSSVGGASEKMIGLWSYLITVTAQGARDQSLMTSAYCNFQHDLTHIQSKLSTDEFHIPFILSGPFIRTLVWVGLHMWRASLPKWRFRPLRGEVSTEFLSLICYYYRVPYQNWNPPFRSESCCPM
jgi:hypothetical protein